MTVMFMNTVAGMGDNDDNAGVSSDIRAGVSLSGALECVPSGEDCDVVPKLSKALPPLLDFHGCDDNTVPYGPCAAASKPVNCWGSGVDSNRALKAKGATAYLYSFPGKGHVPWGSLAAEPAAGTMVAFLAEQLDLAHSECP